MKIRGYTDEQVMFLQDNCALPRQELANRFNKRFGTNKSVGTLKSVCNNHGLYTGRDGRFTSETSVRWQRGLDKVSFKSHYTDESFARMTKKMLQMGQDNRAHVGDTIIRRGIPYIVVSEEPNELWDNRIKNKARYVYEQYYGKIQNDDMVLHIDGDKMNCNIENLILLPQRYRPFFRWHHWWDLTGDLLVSAIKWCELNELVKGARA